MSRLEQKFSEHPFRGNQPKTPEERCYHYRWQDQEFGTDTDSPLHHNHRCTLCGSKRKKTNAHPE
ncbi:hypothetical protein SEA_XENIA2_52 [Gordonia phage Xenia2]